MRQSLQDRPQRLESAGLDFWDGWKLAVEISASERRAAISPFRRSLLPFLLDHLLDLPPERRSHHRHPAKLFLQNKLALPARSNVLLDSLLLAL